MAVSSVMSCLGRCASIGAAPCNCLRKNSDFPNGPEAVRRTLRLLASRARNLPSLVVRSLYATRRFPDPPADCMRRNRVDLLDQGNRIGGRARADIAESDH